MPIARLVGAEPYQLSSALVNYWMSIEVLDGSFSASQWADAHSDSLIETAIWEGAIDWHWQRQGWGVTLEVCFGNEANWDRFRQSVIVRTALETVPDPKTGVIIYEGRGSSGPREPRRPRPLAGSGSAAVALPITFDDLFEDVFGPEVQRPAWLTHPALPTSR